jgi:hypothetical protein
MAGISWPIGNQRKSKASKGSSEEVEEVGHRERKRERR